MKVVLIGPVYPYRGGIAHYTTMLQQQLQGHGREVLLVSFKRQYPQWLFPGESDRDPSGSAVRAERPYYWLDSLNPFTWFATCQRLRSYNPDLLILQWWTTFLAPMLAFLGLFNRLFMQRPLVIICHNVLPHETRRWDRWLARLALAWGTSFVVQSAVEETRLRSLLPHASTTTAPMPLFDLFAGPRLPAADARNRLGLPTDTPILLFFGIVRQYKGLEDLIAALPRVQSQLGKVILVIAGEFWDEKRRYLDLIERLELVDSVVIEGRYIPNEEVPVFFSAADLLVAPYRHLTGSAVVQLARAFDTPVVMNPLLDATHNQSTVKPPAEEALAAAIVAHFRHRGEGGLGPVGRIERQEELWDTLIHALLAPVAPDDGSPLG